MNSIYHLSEVGKRRMRRRALLTMLVIWSGSFVLFWAMQRDQFDFSGGGNVWLQLLPFALLIGMMVITFRRYAPGFADSFSIHLSEYEIALHWMGRARTAITHDRIERIEEGIDGGLFVIGPRGVAVLNLRPDIEGIGELRARLRLLHGDIVPRTKRSLIERYPRLYSIAVAVPLLLVIAFDVPAVVLPAALAQLGFTGWSCLRIARTTGVEGTGRRLILMSLIPVPFVVFKALKVLELLGQ